ncbi:MAG: CBS domain-containing protein [Candidatus Bathyarchaeia archaeon]
MLPSLDEIARKRKMLGLTQKKLARMAGVSQSFIAKIETGKIDPSYNKIKTIFNVLEREENKVNYNAKKIFHRGVLGIQKNETIAKAINLMMKYGYSQLPVFDGEQVVGCVSERTILNQVSSVREPSKFSQEPVEKVMEEAPPQIDENAPLTVVSSLLHTYPAVLVTKKGKVFGIITKADLFKVIV